MTSIYTTLTSAEQLYSLLTLIRETGSVRDACEHMHISYSTSWNLIRTLESQLHE